MAKLLFCLRPNIHHELGVPRNLNEPSRQRMCVFYSGRIQGVGFRFQTRQLATGYEVTGYVRNLSDGRVELVLEGESSELEAFRQAVRDSGLGPLIRGEETSYQAATGEFSDFAIVR